MSIRHVERAVDEIRRGYAVIVRVGRESALALALEHAQESPEPLPGPRTACVVFAAPTARQLKLADTGGASLAVEAEATEKGWRIYASASTAKAPNLLEEAARALVRLSGLPPAALVIPLQPGAEPGDTLSVTAEAIAAYSALPPQLERVTPQAVRLPIKGAEKARVHAFRERGANAEHLALLIGEPDDMPLTRLHSSCLTGDVLGSLRCECGDQLHGALTMITAEGKGVLLYLNQEGRGIGLANKLRAYGLQDQGLDTVDANEMLGFEPDERDFTIASQMLHALKISNVRLLTNNPAKVEALEAAGIRVAERVPLKAEPGEHNKDYLATKARRLKHWL